MGNNDLANYLTMLDEFREYYDKGQNEKALNLLDKIRSAYREETGRDFEDDFPVEKINQLYDNLKGRRNTLRNNMRANREANMPDVINKLEQEPYKEN